MKYLNPYLKDSRVVVFFDFEGTQFSQEIIAIGAIKVQLDNKFQVKSTSKPFKCFVKAKDIVGSYIEDLTGINDNLLAKEGIHFLDAIKNFEKYVGNEENIKFISYGNFDLKMLHSSSVINLINETPFIQKIYHNYIDFSQIVSHFVRDEHNHTVSLRDGLRVFNVTPNGDFHDPKYDAINLMLLYKAFIKERGILREQYLKVLYSNPKLPAPFAKILRDIKKGKTVDESVLIKYIEEEI